MIFSASYREKVATALKKKYAGGSALIEEANLIRDRLSRDESFFLLVFDPKDPKGQPSDLEIYLRDSVYKAKLNAGSKGVASVGQKEWMNFMTADWSKQATWETMNVQVGCQNVVLLFFYSVWCMILEHIVTSNPFVACYNIL